jgi:hypothetical protein
MKRIIPAFSAVLTVSALILKPAAAAPGPTLPVLGGPNSIIGGVFLPSGDAKRNGGSAQIDVDFRYGLPLPNLIAPTRTVFSLGVETGAHDGNHSTIIPLTVSQVFSLNGGSPFAPGAFYAGVGIGGYLENESGISSSVRVGGIVNAGYNFTDSIFLDAKYQLVEHGNGAVVAVGLRF